MCSSAGRAGGTRDPTIIQGAYMKHANATHSAAVLAAAAFLFAGAAVSADTATVTKERSTTTESTPSGSTTTTTTTRTYTKSDSPDVVYKSIDINNRGYVTRQEITRITGFE